MFDEQDKKLCHETLDLWGKPHEQTETRIIGGARITKKKPRETNENQRITSRSNYLGNIMKQQKLSCFIIDLDTTCPKKVSTPKETR